MVFFQILHVNNSQLFKFTLYPEPFIFLSNSAKPILVKARILFSGNAEFTQQFFKVIFRMLTYLGGIYLFIFIIL